MIPYPCRLTDGHCEMCIKPQNDADTVAATRRNCPGFHRIVFPQEGQEK